MAKRNVTLCVEHFDSSGRLTTITSRGQVTTLTYASGQLVTVEGPFGHTLEFDYEGDLLETVTLPDDEVIAYFYDSQGRVTSESHAGGVSSYTFSYAGTTGQPTTVTDRLGTVMQNGFSSGGGFYRPGSQSHACLTCGAYASTTYDAKG